MKTNTKSVGYPTFRTQWVRRSDPSKYYENQEGQESLTIPGLSYTIQQIIERFASGMPARTHAGTYEDNEPDIDNDIIYTKQYDISEREYLREQIRRIKDTDNGQKKPNFDKPKTEVSEADRTTEGTEN